MPVAQWRRSPSSQFLLTDDASPSRSPEGSRSPVSGVQGTAPTVTIIRLDEPAVQKLSVPVGVRKGEESGTSLLVPRQPRHEPLELDDGEGDARAGGPLCGPGFAMAAAFIGPGTIATCSEAGAEYGLSLLWVLSFAIGSCIVLQEQSARVGCVARMGFGEAILGLRPAWARDVIRVLSCVTLAGGNAALQAGNLAGGGMGLAFLLEAHGKEHECAALLGVTALMLLAAGRTGALTHLLGAVVLGMSLLFVACAALTAPSPSALLAGLLVPSFPSGSSQTMLALVGTTLCAYNLFLQSSAVAGACAARPRNADALRVQLRWVRLDTALSALVGGLVSASLMVVSASLADDEGGAGAGAGDASRGGEASDGGEATAVPAAAAAAASAGGVGELARGVARVLGPRAGQAFALGLCAAGLSSAVTAPLAARLAIRGLLPAHPAAATLAWVAVGALGTAVAAVPGLQPLAVIVAAQCLNAVLLPLLGGALVVVASQPESLGSFRCAASSPSHFTALAAAHTTRCVPPVRSVRRNGPIATVAGWTVVTLTCALSVRSLMVELI